MALMAQRQLHNLYFQFIVIGALFHSLAVSLLKLSLAALDLASSFQIFIELALMFLPWSSLPWMLDSSWIGNNYARPFRFLE